MQYIRTIPTIVSYTNQLQTNCQNIEEKTKAVTEEPESIHNTKK